MLEVCDFTQVWTTQRPRKLWDSFNNVRSSTSQLEFETCHDSRDALVGLTIPLGPHTLLASYIRKDDRTAFDQDAHQVAIGYRYTLSRRTSMYAVYARIDNRNDAGYTVGNASESGNGNRGISVGISHAI